MDFQVIAGSDVKSRGRAADTAPPVVQLSDARGAISPRESQLACRDQRAKESLAVDVGGPSLASWNGEKSPESLCHRAGDDSIAGTPHSLSDPTAGLDSPDRYTRPL